MPTGDPTCTTCGYVLPGHHPACTFLCAGSVPPLPSLVQVWEPKAAETQPTDDSKDKLVRYLTEYLNDEVFAQRFADCMEMIRSKNADYTEGAAKRDRIAHFRDAAEDLELPMTKIWQVFVRKHWSAVMKFVKSGKTESEPIDGRINDIINYMVLLGAIIHDVEER